ncbi:toprim domain-containing protein [Nocardia jejuensis]|uniref:toprim domain-containing protein n=1 Tax=Nocardia jejuensis TaxID=328049 RepID=UPI0008308A3F|nr:toprim domain-containing protein [Nocardia jejuensis]
MRTNDSFDTITGALNRVCGPGRHGREWITYLCPVHEADGRSHRPSLGVVYNHGKRRTVVKCFAGCSDEDVLHRLGLHVRDLFDHPGTAGYGRPADSPGSSGRAAEPRPSAEHESPSHSRYAIGSPAAPSTRPPSPVPTANPGWPSGSAQHEPAPTERTLVDQALAAAGLAPRSRKRDLGRRLARPEHITSYIYRDPSGRPAGRINRIHTLHEHGYAKSFWQERYTERGWVPGGFPRLPFRLPELLTALRAGQAVYICEGEADVLTATRAGLTATCNSGGATNWHRDHAAWLRTARRIRIIADRDGPGYRHAARVAATLHPHVPDIRILQARDGKDLTDHCNAGHDLTDLDPVPVLDEHYRPLR